MADIETRVRARLVSDAKRSGFWARSENDRFTSGYPDMRISRADTGQLDIELKILGCSEASFTSEREMESGISALQAIELRDMNKAGAKAVGMVLIPERNEFLFTNTRRFSPGASFARYGGLTYRPLPKNGVSVDFVLLVRMATIYLNSEFGTEYAL